MERKHLQLIGALFLLALAAKLYYLDKTPFMEDETLYAQMISEEAGHLSFLPTWFGYLAPWKPGLYFIVYSLFLPFTSALFSSLEWIYRSPNLIFAAISTFLVFLIAKRFAGNEVGLLAALLFFSNPLSLYVETRLLMEPFTLPLILASVYFYTKEKKTNSDFLAAGIFALLAALTKYVFALSIPILALAYAFTREKQSLKNPAFLVSLLGAPLGILIFFFALNQVGMAESIFFLDMGRGISYDYSASLLYLISLSAPNAFSFLFIFLCAAFVLLKRKEKIEPLFLLWIFFFFLLLLSPNFRTWYLYYALPPLSILAATAIAEKNKCDDFSLFIASIFVIASISIFAISFSSWEENQYAQLNEAKGIGLSLAGGNSTLFLGKYYTNTVAIAYKELEERKVYGRQADFGYIMILQVGGAEVAGISGKQAKAEFDSLALAFVSDYNTDKYKVEDENFAQFFWNQTTFRKKTGIEEFGTVVVSPPLNNPPPGYSISYAGNFSAVYSKK